MAPADYRFWELLNYAVQNEPVESLDPITLGFFASIGIEKGKPFAPDARMKAILTEAAAVGDATARTLTYQSRIPEAFYYPNSTWRQWLGGYKFEKQPGVAYLDAAAFFYFYATGVTPAMEAKMVGQGSQYAVGLLDSQGNPPTGEQSGQGFRASGMGWRPRVGVQYVLGSAAPVYSFRENSRRKRGRAPSRAGVFWRRRSTSNDAPRPVRRCPQKRPDQDGESIPRDQPQLDFSVLFCQDS